MLLLADGLTESLLGFKPFIVSVKLCSFVEQNGTIDLLHKVEAYLSSTMCLMPNLEGSL